MKFSIDSMDYPIFHCRSRGRARCASNTLLDVGAVGGINVYIVQIRI